MAKKVQAQVKLQIPAGKATPAPPVGTALGPQGVNIMEFCKAYNAATESQRGNVIPVEITIYEDRTFTFITKTPPAAELIKKAAGVTSGSANPLATKVGKITKDASRWAPRWALTCQVPTALSAWGWRCRAAPARAAGACC